MRREVRVTGEAGPVRELIAAAAGGSAAESWQLEDATHVVHVVPSITGGSRADRYAAEVGGTETVVQACADADVHRLVVVSSAAAYGYSADNPRPVGEDRPLRADRGFPEAWRAREVEGVVARYDRPEAVVLRAAPVPGRWEPFLAEVLSHRVVVGLEGFDTPIALVDPEDLAHATAAALDAPPGTYNLCGDATVTLSEVARAMGRQYVAIAPGLQRTALGFLQRWQFAPWTPERLVRLQWRPVPDNRKLHDFYTPRFTAAEALARWSATLGVSDRR